MGRFDAAAQDFAILSAYQEYIVDVILSAFNTVQQGSATPALQLLWLPVTAVRPTM